MDLDVTVLTPPDHVTTIHISVSVS